MDVTDFLSGPLNNLRLLSDEIGNDQEPRFSPFPGLPFELRLKILEHTLPPPTTLRLDAHIIISDPSFGLYVTFSISTDGAYSPFEPKPKPHHLTANLKRVRMANLLLTTKESRDFYLSTYPLSLPSGPNGKAQIRFSRLETVFIDNFPFLMKESDFCNAIQNEYRLQDWWTRLETIAIPFSSFVAHRGGRYSYILLKVIRKLDNCRVFNAVVWDGFKSSNLNEDGMKSMKNGMMSTLGNVEHDLSEMFAEDITDGYHVPKLGILGA